MVEQNYGKLSSENGGFGKYTWSYRYVSTNEYTHGWTFYDPSQAGYSISDKASSVSWKMEVIQNNDKEYDKALPVNHWLNISLFTFCHTLYDWFAYQSISSFSSEQKDYY